jgi:hypothetical protein
MSLTVTRRPQQALTLNKWSCVHLPIIYELTSDKYPTNTADSSSGVAAYNSNGGYLRLDLGSIGTINELDFVKISSPNSPTYDGVHQVLQVEAGNIYTLDIAYTSGTIDWTGSVITKYYPNYHAVVRVYAGLEVGHPKYSDKPIELAAELKIIPDSSGKCLFSIHEILKSYIETSNNRIDVPPIGDVDAYNDIAFFTQFYISVAESYDESNAYTIGTFQSSFSDDSLIGYAVNAKLAFRNSNGTYLKDYMNNKFLTLFAIPVLFACSEETPNCFQDISFITESSVNMKFKEEYYSNGVKVTEIISDVPEEGSGVYRAPLSTVDCDYDRVDVTAIGDIDIQEFENLGAGDSWIADGSDNPTVQLNSNTLGVPDNSKYGAIPVFIRSGQTVSIPYKYVVTNVPGSGWTLPVTLSLLDASGTLIAASVENISGVTAAGTYTGVYTVTASEDAYYFAFKAALIMTAPIGGVTGDITFENSATSAEIPLTETKTFDVDCGCSNQEMRLAWFNNLGGIDYWNFTAQKEHGVDIMRTEQVSENMLLLDWATGDTVTKETVRESREYVTVRSQHLTLAQLQAVKYIRSSILVQEIYSAGARRTVLVDNSSFRAYDEGDKLYTIEFRINYTDDIPSLRA